MTLLNPNLDSHTLVLTATRRLAEAIRQNYDQQQQAQDRLIWESPKILPLRSWLQMRWQSQPHASGNERLLCAHQEQTIWRQLIEKTQRSLYPLLHIDNMTPLVQQAWQLLNHWLIPLEEIKKQIHTPEVGLFVQWTEEFMAYCKEHAWISEATLPQRLPEILTRKSLPEKVCFAGFDELSPAYQRLLDSMGQFASVCELTLPPHHHTHYQKIFPDLETEITHMAHWAKDRFEKNPSEKIGCIILQLTQHRPLVMPIFNKVFAPENQLPGMPPRPLPFNVSAGQRLNEFEIIAIALQALHLGSRKFSIASFGQLLQSPYLCQNEIDIHLGAALDVQCRQSGAEELPLNTLFDMIAKWQMRYPGHTWLKRWRAFTALDCINALQLPSAWALHFTEQLTALGWPGGRHLNSLEYQVISRWHELLAELSTLDPIMGEIPFSAALHCLQRFAAQTIFQPKTESNAPIQILGALESGGFYFDALWVMGLDDKSWPPPPQPNPFLPYALQIQRQMPHASAHREFIYAQKITERLLCSAKNIWQSCSPEDSDQAVQFSRLVPPCPTHPGTNNASSATTLSESIFLSAKRETIPDSTGPVILKSEKIRGGSALLTQQAECPFRAFATFRLNAKPLNKPDLGISAKTHGILLHHILELIWALLKDQQTLLAMNASELENLLEKKIDEVIREKLSEPESPFAQIERKRLLSIIGEWLALEKQRPPFQVVEREAVRLIELSGLRLQLKIDRIDKLSDGSHLLIDYKTGLTQIQAWLDARLQQPQLPLYALDRDQKNNFSGIAFAQLHIGKLQFKGLHTESLDTADYFPRGVVNIAAYKDFTAPKTWSDLLTHWHDLLKKLSADFYNGFAAVDPADQGAPCQTCELQMLCRIHSREIS